VKLNNSTRVPVFVSDSVCCMLCYAMIYLGKRKRDNLTIAIKIIDLEESKDDLFTITREINALSHGKSCPQLINYYGSTVMGTKLWIGMEFVDAGSVSDLIKSSGGKLPEKKIAIVVREVLLGLQYLGMEGKIHR
jgi:serine/threonine-protein kinase 24/25/MST4